MKEESSQRRLQTVLYVRSNKSEQPFPVIVNVEQAEPRQIGESLEVVPKPADYSGPAADVFSVWAGTDEYPCGLRIYSWVLILLSFGLLIPSFVIFLEIASDRLWYDTFDTRVSEIGCYVLAGLFLINIIIRLTQSCESGRESTPAERISASLSLFTPGMKYHIARSNPNYRGVMTSNYRLDLICEGIQLAVGIAAIVASQYVYKNGYVNGYQVLISDDEIFINLGLLLLVETVIVFPLTMLLHSRWLSTKLKAERTEREITTGLLSGYAGTHGYDQGRPVRNEAGLVEP